MLGGAGGKGPRVEPLVGAAFAAMVLFWGINFVAVRFSNQGLEPMWGAGARFAVAALLLLAYVRVRGIALPRGRALAGAVWFGVAAFAATYALIYYALVSIPAGAGAVLFATVPLNTFWMALAIGEERFRWPALFGAIVVVAGVGVAFLGDAEASGHWLAYAAAYGSAVASAVAGLVVKRFPRSHPLAMNAVAMAVGAGLLLVASFALGEAWVVSRDVHVRWAFLWLVGSSIGAFSLMVWVLGRWTASAVSYAGVLAPFVAVIAGFLIADEHVGLRFALGAAIVIGGVWLGALWRPRGARPVASGAVASGGDAPRVK